VPEYKYQCLVIDDESHALELLTDYIQSVPSLQLVKTFQDPIAALMEIMPGNPYDFIFLDIDMPGLSGLELARSLRTKTRFLIFTTAHSKYTLEAFDVEADHYLLKPIALSKFATVVARLLQEAVKAKQPLIANQDDKAFFVKGEQKNKFIKIHPDNILAVEGLKNYVVLHTHSHKHVVYLTMKELEEALSASNGFRRVHKSFIVATSHVTQVEGNTITLTNNMQVPIGNSYRQAFYDYIASKAYISGRSG
jgi:two-component system, LytTR family, response regulator